jgi:hypothetical protein
LKRRKWRWIGHTLRKPKHRYDNVTLETTSLGKPYSVTLRESVEEEDQEIPGGETLLLRWRLRVIDGKIWNVWHKTEQGGGLSSVAYAPPRCNRRKQVSK